VHESTLRENTQQQPPAEAKATAEADRDEKLARGIIGTKHDFSDSGRVPRDLCSPCHTPHITAAQAPLLVKRSARIEPQRPYQTKAGELNDASLVCLSCHDGTVARDVYAGTHAMSWSELSAMGLEPGKTRLTNHPVGVKYPEGEAKYHSVAAVESSGRIRLPGGRIQCTTCHDPHNSEQRPYMLIMSNERSRLCLSCHRL
jgi:predicted CXXCH cytochrome family protein